MSSQIGFWTDLVDVQEKIWESQLAPVQEVDVQPYPFLQVSFPGLLAFLWTYISQTRDHHSTCQDLVEPEPIEIQTISYTTFLLTWNGTNQTNHFPNNSLINNN